MLNNSLFRLLIAVIISFVLVSVVFAESDFLPGGTAVSISLDSPNEGSQYEAVDGVATIPLSGVASIGSDAPEPDTSLIFLLDISGSTEEHVGSALFCPDQNPGDVDPGDPVPDENEIIDCEIGAALALNQQAIALGTVDEVAAVVFAGDAVAADATPDTIFSPFTQPDADRDGNGRFDIVEVLQSIEVAFLFGHDSGFELFHDRATPDIVKTDYADALRRAQEIAVLASNENVMIVMVSDGINNAGSAVDDVLPIEIPGKKVVIQTFAIPDSYGFGGNCTTDWDGRGSLQKVVDAQNAVSVSRDSRCHNVSDPGALPELLPEIIVPTMLQLSYQINDAPEMPFTPDELSLALPQPGPIDVTFATGPLELPVGDHMVCVHMDGIDTGGSGRVSECTVVYVTTPFQIPDEIGRGCDERYYPMVAVQGQGLRDETLPFTLSIDDEAVQYVITQATMKAEVRVPMPESVTLGNSNERIDLALPTHDNGGYVYEARFEQNGFTSVDATGSGFEPLSLVNYLLYRDETAVAQSVTFVNQFVNRGSYQQLMAVEPYDALRDLHLLFVLSDIDADAREVELWVSAGDVMETAVVTTPNMGNGLAIYEMVLENVPGDIAQVETQLTSARPNGDSVFWNSAIVTYPCSSTDLGDSSVPFPHALFIPIMFGEE